MSCSILLAAQEAGAGKRPWSQDVLYFVMTDRFYDGDKENNEPEGCAKGLHDPKQRDIGKYHGGDLRGLELALRSGYFNELGVTALWITPPLANVWYAKNEEKTGYHGYWIRDFLDIDPHLTSKKDLDGKPYPEGREGRLAHYRDFVKLAHSRGIKVIQDAVCNHTGPLFYYDEDGDGALDMAKEWIQPFSTTGAYADATWADLPEWNIGKAAPKGSLHIFGKEFKFSGILTNLEAYTRRGYNGDSLGKSDGEEILADFLGNRDINTDPEGPHFQAIVEEFVNIYAFYIEECGVDGLRIDTIKHVHHSFWSEFTEQLRKRIGEQRAKEVLLFGEVYDGNPEKLGSYTYHKDWPTKKQPALDSVLNFQLCWAARAFFRHPGDEYGKPDGIRQALDDMQYGKAGGGRPFYNPTPGTTGLNSRKASITFLENHDGINRFRVDGVTEHRNLLTNAFVMLMGGIPCLYYGTEGSCHDKKAKIGEDAETGRMTFLPATKPGLVKDVRKAEAYQGISALAAIRRAHPTLQTGATGVLYPQIDGVLLLARYNEEKPSEGAVIVAFNLNKTTTSLESEGVILRNRDGKILIPEGTERLQNIPVKSVSEEKISAAVDWEDGVPYAALKLPPRSVTVWTTP